jgi:SAM-dependent methyltransferase
MINSQETYKTVDWRTIVPDLTSRMKKALSAEEEYISRKLVGNKILDVGTGTGRSIDIILDKIRRAEITSIDINEQNIEYVRNKYSMNIEFLLGDIFDYNPKDKFDSILLTFNFFGNMYPEPKGEELLKHLRNILSDKGKIIGSVYADSGLEMQLEFYNKKLHCETKIEGSYTVLQRKGITLVSRRFNKKELSDIFENNGYKVDIEKKENWYLYSARKL